MKRAAFLCAILLIPLLPIAEAAGPTPIAWSPYNAVSEVSALAMAREGTTIAAALKAAVAQPGVPTGVPGVPGSSATNVAAADLAILEHETGFARNGTTLAPTPQGRTHVAVSRDGTSIASVGVDGPTPSTFALRLQYQRIQAGTNWSAATPYERSLNLAASNVVVHGLAISDDGRRVAVLTREADSYVVRGFAFSISSLDSAFEIRAPGVPRALAGSGSLDRLVVAGQFPVGNFTYGGAFLLPFAQGTPTSSHFDTTQNNTDVLSVAMSRDGNVVALGGADGRLHLFRGGALASPSTLTIGAGTLGNLTLSEDGTRAAATIGLTLTTIDATTTSVVWNASLTGVNVTGLAMNRTGGLLLVGTGGTGGYVAAFGATENAPLWSIPGDTRGVAIDSAGTRIAYAQRVTIGAAALPRTFTMELTDGGKVAPQRELTAPGTTTYGVTLRNDGAAAEHVVFEEGSPDVTVTSEPSTVIVNPGATVRANITIAIQQGLSGPRVFNVTARAITSGVLDNVTLSISPKPTLDVKLFLNETEVLAEAGKTSTILLGIINNGTSDAPVDLRALQVVSGGPLWDLKIGEPTLTALRGTRSAVKVEMTPPADVVNGTSSTVTFTLEGTDIFDTASVTFRVNPDLKVKVNATGVTKFIEPGKRASYNVTITNIGTLPRQFEVFYEITESTGRSWGVDMQAQTIGLAPDQSRVFPVTIIAPGDVQPNERVSVRVSARSIPEVVNETRVMDNVTLFGVAVPLKITTTTPTPNALPFPTPLAILALVVGVALLHRRRYQ